MPTRMPAMELVSMSLKASPAASNVLSRAGETICRLGLTVSKGVTAALVIDGGCRRPAAIHAAGSGLGY